MKIALARASIGIALSYWLIVGCSGQGLKKFVNTPDNLPEVLARNYIDFSFQYPANWQIDPQNQPAGARNFVKIARQIDAGKAGKFTLENFAVGWFPPLNLVEDKEQQLKRLAKHFNEQIKPNLPEYQKVAEGKTKVGDKEGYEFRFTSASRNTAKGDITIWGRVIFLPKGDRSSQGAILIMLASSLAPEIKSPADVGKKGELSVILNSFKFSRP